MRETILKSTYNPKLELTLGVLCRILKIKFSWYLKIITLISKINYTKPSLLGFILEILKYKVRGLFSCEKAL